MRSILCSVDEIFLDGYVTASLKCPPTFIGHLGQYIVINLLNGEALQPGYPFTPIGFKHRSIELGAPIPAEFVPGVNVMVNGPFGNGFTIPVGANKILMVSTRRTASLVLALSSTLKPEYSKVSLICKYPPSFVHPVIEVLPDSMFAEALRWADYCGIETEKSQYPALLATLIDLNYQNTLPPIQIYIESDKPCSGITACGVCTVKNRQGKVIYLCKDGPVINF